MSVSYDAIKRLKTAVEQDRQSPTRDLSYGDLQAYMRGNTHWPLIDQAIVGYKAGHIKLSEVNDALAEVFGKGTIRLVSNNQSATPADEAFFYFRADSHTVRTTAQTVENSVM